MATSVFKSTTRRTPIAAAAAESSSSRSIRRSRSHSRFSRPIYPEHEGDYSKNVPRGQFVNTTRGSTTPFSEISLDDMALEFFSSCSSTSSFKNENETERKRQEIRRWASDTASSRRRGRSVSVSRMNAASCSTAKGKNASSSDAVSLRRRSLSVARNQIEAEVYSHKSRNWADPKANFKDNSRMHRPLNGCSRNELRIGRSRSRTDHSLPCHDYSSQSSALTDDELKGIQVGRSSPGKTNWTAYSHEKADHRAEHFDNGPYEAMRRELRYAVEEIRSEFNQLRTYGDCIQDENSVSLRELPRVRETCATKLRKRSCDRSSASEALMEEAEKYFEDFICNIDTDISSIDGEKSDERASFEVGGVLKAPYTPKTEQVSSILAADTRGHVTSKTPAVSTLNSAEMEGVVLPWLQWETVVSSYFSSTRNEEQSPVASAVSKCESKKEHEFGGDSTSSSSWSPCDENCIDTDEYLSHRSDEQLVFEIYRERNRIHSGCLLICHSTLY